MSGLKQKTKIYLSVSSSANYTHLQSVERVLSKFDNIEVVKYANKLSIQEHEYLIVVPPDDQSDVDWTDAGEISVGKNQNTEIQWFLETKDISKVFVADELCITHNDLELYSVDTIDLVEDNVRCNWAVLMNSQFNPDEMDPTTVTLTSIVSGNPTRKSEPKHTAFSSNLITSDGTVTPMLAVVLL